MSLYILSTHLFSPCLARGTSVCGGLEAHAKLVRMSLAGDLEMEPANLVIKRSGHFIRLAQTNERNIRDIGAQTF
jgi:hypothetical protein